MKAFDDRAFEYPDATLARVLCIRIDIDRMTGKQSDR
jgi:hypothetical protein